MVRRRPNAEPGQPYQVFGLMLVDVLIAASQFSWTATSGEWLVGLFKPG